MATSRYHCVILLEEEKKIKPTKIPLHISKSYTKHNKIGLKCLFIWFYWNMIYMCICICLYMYIHLKQVLSVQLTEFYICTYPCNHRRYRMFLALWKAPLDPLLVNNSSGNHYFNLLSNINFSFPWKLSNENFKVYSIRGLRKMAK